MFGGGYDVSCLSKLANSTGGALYCLIHAVLVQRSCSLKIFITYFDVPDEGSRLGPAL